MEVLSVVAAMMFVVVVWVLEMINVYNVLIHLILNYRIIHVQCHIVEMVL